MSACIATFLCCLVIEDKINLLLTQKPHYSPLIPTFHLMQRSDSASISSMCGAAITLCDLASQSIDRNKWQGKYINWSLYFSDPFLMKLTRCLLWTSKSRWCDSVCGWSSRDFQWYYWAQKCNSLRNAFVLQGSSRVPCNSKLKCWQRGHQWFNRYWEDNCHQGWAPSNGEPRQHKH